jgi:uncharacterized protein YecE (DUF72 family)
VDTPAHLTIGTCAWSFDDWRGVFYPEHLPAGDRLEFYARHFPAVEADSTFYHAPAPHVAAHWAEVTPPDFAFACKLSREITHERMLRDCAEPLRAFTAAIAPLGRKLSCVLVQLPPFFQLRRDETALRDFVRHLPADVRFAIEFRHADWHLPRIAHLMEEHGVAWVWSDDSPLEQQSEGAFEFLPDTADFIYVRLMGDLEKKYRGEGGRIHHYRELQWPRDAALEHWAARIRQAAGNHRQVFVAVNNHFEGFAPQTVQRLAEKLGLPLSMPDLATSDGQQMDLL